MATVKLDNNSFNGPPQPVSTGCCDAIWNYVKEFFEFLLSCCYSQPVEARPLRNRVIPVNHGEDGQLLVDFWSGERIPMGRGDCAGHTFEDILALEGKRNAYGTLLLESRHNYIQWIFDIDEPSRAQPLAPVATAESIEECNQLPDYSAKQVRALAMMIRFFGGTPIFENGNLVEIIPPEKSTPLHWVSPGNHNYLRITRILKSLRLHNRLDLAVLFLNFMEQIVQSHSPAKFGASPPIWRKVVAEASPQEPIHTSL